MTSSEAWTADWADPISFLSNRYRLGESRPTEIVEACFDRIQRHDQDLAAFSNLLRRQALADAGASDARFAANRPKGPLDGVPIAAKDVFDIAGTVTTANSHAFKADRPAQSDASVIQTLKSQGAVFVGKTTLYELGTGDPDQGPFASARNPWDTDLATGGSSSGSAAAVAAGFCAAALGTDTGGSVRIPAALCGVAGFKPTTGILPVEGVVPLSWSLDHVGILAPTAKTISTIWSALFPEPRMPNVGRGGLRIATPTAFVVDTPGIGADVLENYRQCLEVIAQSLSPAVDVEMPFLSHVPVIGEVIARADAFAAHGARLRSGSGTFGASVLGYLARGASYSAADYVHASRGRDTVKAMMAAAMQEFDLLVLPTVSNTAGPAGSRLADLQKTRFTRPFNVTGQPAITVNSGVDRRGRPVGFQFVGKAGDDSLVLAAACAFEAALFERGVTNAKAIAERYG